jgi:hypothetical protein
MKNASTAKMSAGKNEGRQACCVSTSILCGVATVCAETFSKNPIVPLITALISGGTCLAGISDSFYDYDDESDEFPAKISEEQHQRLLALAEVLTVKKASSEKHEDQTLVHRSATERPTNGD